jgi:hypothetical protein
MGWSYYFIRENTNGLGKRFQFGPLELEIVGAYLSRTVFPSLPN